jgi:hypothetical protein
MAFKLGGRSAPSERAEGYQLDLYRDGSSISALGSLQSACDSATRIAARLTKHGAGYASLPRAGTADDGW